MSRTGKLIYTVDGIGSVTFSSEKPYYLLSFDGMSVGTRAISDQAIGLDGQRTTAINLNTRTIPCELAVSGLDANNRHDYLLLRKRQQELARLFNPLNTGTLTRVNQYGTYQIHARPTAVPRFERFVGSVNTFAIDFECDNPVWKSTNTKKFYIGGEKGNELTIINTSDMELPLIISGVCIQDKSFVLTNASTGEKITLAVWWQNFDRKFSLDTETCEVKAQSEEGGSLVSSNFIFSFDSAIDMKLKLGENRLVLSPATLSTTFTIEIADRYVGVG